MLAAFLLLVTAVDVEIIETDIPPDGWPTNWPRATERYTEPALAPFYLPWRYTGTGVRAARPSPILLRAGVTDTLPAGRYRLLLRARGGARVLLDGKELASLPAPTRILDGHNAVRHDALELGLTRRVAAGDREKLCEVVLDGKPHRWELQVRVGGLIGKSRLRLELGETLVALAPVGSNDFFLLGERIALTDDAWDEYAGRVLQSHDERESSRRREAMAAHADALRERRRQDRLWLAAHPAPAVPRPTPGLPAFNEVDHFLNPGIAAALANRHDLTLIDFQRDIRPLFEKHCLACHDKKPRGGLRLTARKDAMAGGESGPALVVGKPNHSELFKRLNDPDPNRRMPPGGRELTQADKKLIEKWIAQGVDWPDTPRVTLSRLPESLEPLAFLRRVHLDLVGTAPTLNEIYAFKGDRRAVVDRLLQDPRHTDAWLPYWQDVLAENPNLINPTLNNGGPFRWWLRDVLRDNKPWDLAVRELAMLDGDPHGGGTAGFGMAAQNDAPMAARVGIMVKAFLAVEMKCARCHDAPYHAVKQADLFHLAAMLARNPVTVPATSSVPVDKLEGRKSLITVTLKPNESVQPRWTLDRLLEDTPGPADSRVRLGERITAAANERFAQVIVNRVWKRYMGRGIVEPADDWENARPSHPELLRWLAWKFVASGYDLRFLEKLVLSSHAYQRQATPETATVQLFAAPARRRPWPEAMADTLFDSFGRRYDLETLTLDLDAGRTIENGSNFGTVRRAWQLVYLTNDRDRPSLDLPRARAVTELLTAFGWDGNRQEAITAREAEPSSQQAAVLANGTATRWLTRVSDDSALLPLAMSAPSPEALTEALFLRILTRRPTDTERGRFASLLAPGFDSRALAVPPSVKKPRLTQPYITWANHLQPEANRLRMEEEKRSRQGPQPTTQLQSAWRERLEDALWALLNAPEIAYVP